MLINIIGAKCIGIEAIPVTVEVDINGGIGIHLVGLADAAVKESLLRTVTALQSQGFHIPGKKIVINLAPADLHKNGSGYDLPIALGIIAASGQVELPGLGKYLIMGELGLDATLRAVPGALPMAELARGLGLDGCIFPEASAMEATELRDLPVYGARTWRTSWPSWAKKRIVPTCWREGKRRTGPGRSITRKGWIFLKSSGRKVPKEDWKLRPAPGTMPFLSALPEPGKVLWQKRWRESSHP